MRVLPITVITAALLLGAASRGAAQSVNPSTPQAPVDQTVIAVAQSADDPELLRWMEEFTAWKQWWVEWANRPQPGVFTSTRARRERPVPPAWLSPRCAEVFAEKDPLAPACALLEQWQENDLAEIARATRRMAVQVKEDEPHTTWWEHIHVDLLWPATQLRDHVYGVVGMHTATTVKGRLEVFLGPGVMLLNVPELDGSRVWKVAANYGIGYRIGDFNFPGGRPASLHVNIAKSWLFTDTRELIVGRNVDFAGLSITFKKR